MYQSRDVGPNSPRLTPLERPNPVGLGLDLRPSVTDTHALSRTDSVSYHTVLLWVEEIQFIW